MVLVWPLIDMAMGWSKANEAVVLGLVVLGKIWRLFLTNGGSAAVLLLTFFSSEADTELPVAAAGMGGQLLELSAALDKECRQRAALLTREVFPLELRERLLLLLKAFLRTLVL